jgi:hypothetical protein
MDDDTWRLYEYRNGSYRALRTHSPPDNVTPGRGYWFRHIRVLDTLRLAVSGTALTWSTLSPFAITLEYGWNLIGSPYLFPVYIDDRLIDTDSVSSFLRQTTGAEPAGSEWWEIISFAETLPPLEPWRGYAIWCENPGGYTLYLSPHYDPGQGMPPDDGAWMVTMALHSGNYEIGQIDIGMHPKAGNGQDIFDSRPVELFGRAGKLRLITQSGLQLIRDIRAEQSPATWSLDISNTNSQSLCLQWLPVHHPPDYTSIVLYDAVAKQIVDMGSESEYIIPNASQLPLGRLTVLAGDPIEINEALGRIPDLQPRLFKIYQNYPNPFNASTTISYDLPASAAVKIEVFNLLGQVVAIVEDKYKAAGSYQVTWDGSTTDEQPAASGIYLARITAGLSTGTVKMILLK